jgi:hypothetical protein
MATDDTSSVFAERLLLVIDEGRRTATYKLALLLALIDGCAAHAGPDGRAPEVLHTRTIAEHVLRLYFPQARAYLGPDGEALHLDQITLRRSAMFNAILRLHLLADAERCRGITQVAARLPEDYEATLDAVETTFARYPLRLLQVVGREHRPFLYDIDWTDSVSLRTLHGPGGGIVRFRPGAGDHLLRLAPLLRPLIELHWTRMVAGINRINLEDDRLRAHLFGTERTTFPAALRAGLAELQDHACFYCGDTLSARAQVDHVLPWARQPNDAIENLVLADRCNTAKRDHLPALVHVDRWAHRLVTRTRNLVDLAETARWESDPQRSIALMRSTYAHLPAGTPLWLRDDLFTDDDPALITARLADLPPHLTGELRGCE